MEPNDQFRNIQLENLQKLVGNQLEKAGIEEKLRRLSTDKNANEEDIINKIKETGIIDEVMSNLRTLSKNDQMKTTTSQSNNTLSLYLQLNQGFNFIDYDVKGIIDSQVNKPPAYFEFDIFFLGQRFHTRRIPASSDFQINQNFLLDFNPLRHEIDLTYNLLKKISSPIHIVILLHEDNTTKIIASKSIEWRWILCYGSWKTEAEFKSPSSLNNVNVGSLEMILSLVPIIDKSHLLSQSSVTDQLNDERKSEIERTQDFIQYSTQWWEDYKSIRPSHASRIVKIFLPTEDREYYAYKPATSVIEPISVGRAINTPYEAARFVSLIPFERRENPGGEKVEIWHSMHSFLSLLKGDVEDHVVLLCNLLLGFGLDAYVASGFAVNGPHLWVLTRNKINSTNYQVTFWESLTGQRISVEDPKIFKFYKKIHCVFNDNSFYANIQNDDNVFNSIYNFADSTIWKGLPKDKIAGLTKYSVTPILEVINVDKYKVEMDMEKIIKGKISKYRTAMELKTTFDNKLSHLISPALVNYEMERISNLTYGNEEFKASVKNYVPEGFTFKAYPFQINELDSEKIFGMILSSEVGKDILNTRGDSVTFAVRCKLYPYPQNIYSLWVMVATKYRVIK